MPMSAPLVFSLCPDDPFAGLLAAHLQGQLGQLTTRRFADGETYLRVLDNAEGRDVVVCQSLNQPDDKLLGLLFLAATLRDMGARRVGLAAPYLAYLRQDRRFQPGEALSSRVFAEVLSEAFDWLVTVDPHLHRLLGLEQVYAIPCRVQHAAPILSAWIKQNAPRPLLVGPDMESAQWVKEVALGAGAPFVVAEKTRLSDTEVRVEVPGVSAWPGHTPVLVDDILSTGHTMAETVQHLLAAGTPAPWCVAVHGVFAEGADDLLKAAGAARIVTTNTIPHASNHMDVSELVAQAVSDFLTGSAG